MRPRSRVPHQIRQIKKREKIDLGLIPAKPLRRRVDREAVSIHQARKLWNNWFHGQGWTPYPFQLAAWESQLRGESGAISVPTGSGKTLAAIGGPLMRMIASGTSSTTSSGIRLLYITPVKALTRDIENAIGKILAQNEFPFRVQTRTGDTATADRTRIKKDPPEILITTPESLALMTSESGWLDRFRNLESVVIDEWHELLGSKRGSLLELTLSRLRSFVPTFQTWAVTATIGNLLEAAKIATASVTPTLIQDDISRETDISMILPASATLWFGSAGLKLREEVASAIDPNEVTLLFTNTRAQAELWYQALKFARPEWDLHMAVHHGSLDKDERQRVEDGVKTGTLKLVIATSSLDLGVDFPHVKKIVQIGSVKTVARALQRSGRSEHRLGLRSQMAICPTNLVELFEIRAVRRALEIGDIEKRKALQAPLDVVVQFALNCALEDGYRAEQLKAWVRSAASFQKITDEEFDWVLNFVVTGGRSLSAYPEFHKLQIVNEVYSFADSRLAQLHRLNVGTISSSAGVAVQFMGGKKLGFADEAFLMKLKPGDVFQFSGKTLQLVRLKDMNAIVRLSKNKKSVPAVWGGQALSLSAILAQHLREELSNSNPLSESSLEQDRINDFVQWQSSLSHMPQANELLVEQWDSKAGHHTFIYLFEGRSVHEGFGHLLAFRLSKNFRNTISVAANDYGLELLSTEPLVDHDLLIRALTDSENMQQDIEASLNFPEMVKRAFRDIARVAGLVQQTVPGREKSTRQVQMGTGLLFDVLKTYDSENLLLHEAYKQARQEQLDVDRLLLCAHRAANSVLVIKKVAHLTPLAFPLYIERVRSQVSTEDLHDRISRMQRNLFGELNANTNSR